jgi:GPH family glycoside/pentoside/hexuronide:cation symporter
MMNGEGSAASNRIGIGMKFGYGVGDFAFNLAYQTTALFLLYFFTDVFAIGAAAAGTIFLVSKLWDAVSDPMMGYISDHTNSRWGKKRPYILFGAVPLGLALYLLFASPDIPVDMRFIYGLITFILFCTVITVLNVPYAALTASLTIDIKERANITGYRMTFGLIGTLVAAGATKLIVGAFPNEVTGFRMMSIFYALVIAAVMFTTFASVRERVVHVEEKQPFLKNLGVIFVNRPFLILAAATIMFMIAINMLAAVVNYYFKYNLNAEKMIPIAFLALFVTAVVFIPLFVYISNKKSKKYAFNLGMGFLALTLIALFFFGERDMSITIAIFIAAGVGMTTVFLSPWAMIPDTVEYSEWKTGLRREGILYGCFFFCFKLGSALAGFLAGLGLDIFGYVANVEQSESSLLGIRLMISLVPLIFIIAGMVLLSAYPIDEAYHRKIVSEIEARG